MPLAKHRKSRKSKRNIKKTTGPPPRCGFRCDAVLQRGGKVVDIRRLYCGPKADPDDLVELLSSVIAATMINALPNDSERMEAKAKLIDLLEKRVVYNRSILSRKPEEQPEETEQVADEPAQADI